MSFTHLQVRSGYSLLDSTVTIEKLTRKASELGFKALALTDEHVLYGVIPFYQSCIKHGIKPIIGMIVNVLDENLETEEQCIFLAKNDAGYKNLIRLSTDIKVDQRQGIEKDQLHIYKDGLICILSLNPLSHLSILYLKNAPDAIKRSIDSWKALWNEDDFYLGIQDHEQPIERQLLQQIGQYKDLCHAPIVAINDVRYIEEQDDMAFDCLQSIKKGAQWSGDKIDESVKNRHLRSMGEMERLYGDSWLEALRETETIQQKCTVHIDFDHRMMPQFPLPHSIDAHTYLKNLCFEKVKGKYHHVSKEVVHRLTYELDVIQSMDFSDYFLIVSDFIDFANKQQIIVGPGRGSAAGSLVAYVLGITDVDPLKYGLLFERFLNPERVTMPDIDIDFSDHRRDEVIEYVHQKYGADHVAQIITFGTFAARSLLRELIKTMRIDEKDGAYILQQFPVQSRKTIIEQINESNDLKTYIKQSKQLRYFFSVASKLEGLPRHVSTHAAGVIISSMPLTEHVPLTTGSHDIHLTQYPMNDLEAIGLLKMDFLGLRNLTLLERILKSISLSKRQHISLNDIKENDPKTYALLQKGQTNGVFQLESEGMKKVLTQLKPNHYEDIVAVNALFRPGPMAYISTYIKRKHRLESVSYPHPDLKPILEKTYGVLVYQEQIMQIVHTIAGYSYGEADIFRRAMSKKQESVLREQEDTFIQSCVKNGYEQDVAKEIFRWIVKFSNYGFNRSHAVAYSKIAYQLAYLKAHYPAHFFAELLSSIRGQFDKVSVYIQEAKRIQLPILQPSINKSFGNYSVENEALRMGLLSIKGIGYQTVKEIIRAREQKPFSDLFDFCLRISLKIVNRQAIELLILAGAFDETYANRASLLASIDQALEQGELFGGIHVQQSMLPDVGLKELYTEMDDFTQMKKLSYEKELLGIYISSHPLKEERKKLHINGFMSLDHAKRHFNVNKKPKCAVIIHAIKTIRTKRGDPMAFLVIGDETEEMEAVVFPELYRQKRNYFQEEELVCISGKLEERNQKLQYIIQGIEHYEKMILPINQRLFIKVTAQNNTDALEVIQDISRKNSGHIPIIIYDEEKKRTYQLAKEYSLNPSEQSLFELMTYFGKENVVLESLSNK